ncbi:thermonuclease [Macrococcus sp. DPC7161]|nr:thermonuclease [Macrococcus sp. DPC7161]
MILNFILSLLLGTSLLNQQPHIPVQYVHSVDGDTVVVKKNHRNVTVRLLLVDTPESKKPNTPVQPYAIEASKFTESLVKTCDLSIQYDTKGKTDKYGRDLVYLYCGNEMVNKTLVEKGYARVGYVYQQKDHLRTLENAQSIARAKGLKIWSIKGYVNEDGEGFNDSEADRNSEGSFSEFLRKLLHNILDDIIDGVIKALKDLFK